MAKPLLILCVLISINSFGQLQLSKLVGKGSDQFNLGYGGFLKFAYPVSDAADLSLEVGANIFTLQENTAYGWATVPVKLGYRYIFGQQGAGFYLMPQAGYNVYGIDPADEKFKGLILAGNAGYLFKASGKIQIDLGLLYETAFHQGGAANYVAFRISHNFMFGSRNEEE